MAGFRTHITVSSALGVVYGGAAIQVLGVPTESAVLATGLTAVGGMLPDLDSDSGVPVREMFGLAAMVLPLTIIPWLYQLHLSQEGILASLLFGYVFIRYVASRVFKRFTVHRGMYHSIPGMLIAGLIVYLGYHSEDRRLRLLLGCGIMAGFLSHLVLDELYSVDLRGVKVKLNKFAGTAVKFCSPSLPATVTCYLLLGALTYLAYLDFTTGATSTHAENSVARVSDPGPSVAAKPAKLSR